METQVSLNSVVHLHPENVSTQDGDRSVKSSIQDHVGAQQPVKKPTRQWAAWTREEEECFFTALRQVGKNFEKITRRVQSKNKDQVRHYYYRLVRRMNKLLGPGLCLDAKNSKDTNAAMLRWWSLLEKYSCKASKLHLKPRRFKLFIEALENQLLKDRKKNIRKRPFQGENGSPVAPGTVTNQNRDNRTVKLVLVDSQNIQKMGPGKGSLKRNVNIGIIRANAKGDSNAMKPPRQRRKQGVVSSATYKKWEKTAIAGVSLVADAAEHLERTAIDQGLTGEKENEPVEKVLPSLPVPSQYHYSENNVPSQYYYAENNAFTNLKLKLQLFPIDDGTRKSLEMDKHNPHLELTLSTRKRISSVLEHLNRKWGNSSAASGELMLFPYGVQHRENLVGYQRWTQDSTFSAGDVYTSIGSPSVFRLRYGWFSNSDFAPTTSQASLGSSCIPGEDMVDVESGKRNVDFAFTCGSEVNVMSGQLVDTGKDLTEESTSHAPAPGSSIVPDETSDGIAAEPRSNHSGTAANVTWHHTNAGDGTNLKQMEEADDLRLTNGTALSAGEWADSLTNISVGDLLSDVNTTYIEPPVVQSDQCLQQIPFSCDSFDAAIAAHMSRQQNKMGFPSIVTSTASSIWDADETCDAFSFQKHQSVLEEVSAPSDIASLDTGEQTATTRPSDSFMTELHASKEQVDYAVDEDPMDECAPELQVMDSTSKDFTALTDIYWPDSLGPLDLDIPSSKYHSEDLILSDSLSGLNRLIASSLDAFQNCSFFGLEKKDLSLAVEARETTSFSDCKIGSGV